MMSSLKSNVLLRQGRCAGLAQSRAARSLLPSSLQASSLHSQLNYGENCAQIESNSAYSLRVGIAAAKGITQRPTRRAIVAQVAPFDQAWSPSIEVASIAPQIFAASLFPYLAFLYYLTRSGKEVPRLTLFGFYFLLVFVGTTIPAGIYAKLNYGTSLANVDWLHGTAESLLTITNLLIVLGLRQGIREAEIKNKADAEAAEAAAAAAGAAEPAATKEKVSV